MLNTVSITVASQQYRPIDETKKRKHRHLVSNTGYAALGFGTAAGITGLKKVKFKHKMKVHKYSAYIAAAATILHLGVVKGLDKVFQKKN